MFNWETHMDFVGQLRAEQLYRAIITAFGVGGIAYGFYLQSFMQTVFVLAAGTALACLVTLPPWPFYRRNPLKWLKAIPIPEAVTETESKESVAAGAGAGGAGDEKAAEKPKKKKN